MRIDRQPRYGVRAEYHFSPEFLRRNCSSLSGFDDQTLLRLAKDAAYFLAAFEKYCIDDVRRKADSEKFLKEAEDEGEAFVNEVVRCAMASHGRLECPPTPEPEQSTKSEYLEFIAELICHWVAPIDLSDYFISKPKASSEDQHRCLAALAVRLIICKVPLTNYFDPIGFDGSLRANAPESSARDTRKRLSKDRLDGVASATGRRDTRSHDDKKSSTVPQRSRVRRRKNEAVGLGESSVEADTIGSMASKPRKTADELIEEHEVQLGARHANHRVLFNQMTPADIVAYMQSRLKGLEQEGEKGSIQVPEAGIGDASASSEDDLEEFSSDSPKIGVPDTQCARGLRKSSAALKVNTAKNTRSVPKRAAQSSTTPAGDELVSEDSQPGETGRPRRAAAKKAIEAIGAQARVEMSEVPKQAATRSLKITFPFEARYIGACIGPFGNGKQTFMSQDDLQIWTDSLLPWLADLEVNLQQPLLKAALQDFMDDHGDDADWRLGFMALQGHRDEKTWYSRCDYDVDCCLAAINKTVHGYLCRTVCRMVKHGVEGAPFNGRGEAENSQYWRLPHEKHALYAALILDFVLDIQSPSSYFAPLLRGKGYERKLVDLKLAAPKPLRPIESNGMTHVVKWQWCLIKEEYEAVAVRSLHMWEADPDLSQSPEDEADGIVWSYFPLRNRPGASQLLTTTAQPRGGRAAEVEADDSSDSDDETPDVVPAFVEGPKVESNTRSDDLYSAWEKREDARLERSMRARRARK